MKVSFSPDIIPSGSLASKRQLTNPIVGSMPPPQKKKEKEKEEVMFHREVLTTDFFIVRK